MTLERPKQRSKGNDIVIGTLSNSEMVIKPESMNKSDENPWSSQSQKLNHCSIIMKLLEEGKDDWPNCSPSAENFHANQYSSNF